MKIEGDCKRLTNDDVMLATRRSLLIAIQAIKPIMSKIERSLMYGPSEERLKDCEIKKDTQE